MKINVDESEELVSKYNIKSIPEQLIFNKGQIIVRQVGAKSKEIYKNMIDKIPTKNPKGDIILIWINAFISKEWNGSKVIQVGEYKGGHMIDGPINNCYLTDNRSWSSQLNASSRIHSEVYIDISGELPIIQRVDNRCDFTVSLDCKTGDVTGRGKADNNRINWIDLQGTPKDFSIRIEAAANNPLIHPSPDIDYEGKISISVNKNNAKLYDLIFDGNVDEFPYFEAYVKRGDAIHNIFQILPKPGAAPWKLLGPANRPVKTSVIDF